MEKYGFTRRKMLQGAGALVAAPALLASGAARSAAADTVRIGYVAPRSGALGQLAEGDVYGVNKIREAIGNKITIAGKDYAVEILERDTQSDPNRAAKLASDLILKDNVHVMLVGSTPDTTNPVGDQCEANGVPCISSATPWQPWFFGRGGVPGKPFKWTNHFFWGGEDLTRVYIDLWNSLPTNKVAGCLWPNDPDGLAFADPEKGFPGELRKRGFTVVDTGRYENLKDDFYPEIAKFKSAGVQIVTGVMLPPDLATFLVQSKQQGFKPTVVTVAKAALFAKGVEAFPAGLGENLSAEVYWGPQFPFKSSLTGQLATEMTQTYEADTKNQWLQAMGYGHALFEVGIDALRRSRDLAPANVMAAVNATNLDTCVGHIKWGEFQPFPNVAKTPLAVGQWQKGANGKYELVVTNSDFFPQIIKNGTLKPKVW